MRRIIGAVGVAATVLVGTVHPAQAHEAGGCGHQNTAEGSFHTTPVASSLRGQGYGGRMRTAITVVPGVLQYWIDDRNMASSIVPVTTSLPFRSLEAAKGLSLGWTGYDDMDANGDAVDHSASVWIYEESWRSDPNGTQLRTGGGANGVTYSALPKESRDTMFPAGYDPCLSGTGGKDYIVF